LQIGCESMMKYYCKISFFENIIYWFWYYSSKIKVAFPWGLAQLLISILEYLNVALIVYIVLRVTNVNNLDIKGSVFGLLFPVIFIINLVLYRSKKYCIQKVKCGLAWNEKYCILKEKYDNMSQEQKSKCKTTFFVYCISTIAISAIAAIFVL